MLELSLVQRIAIWLVPVVLAITVHEVAHGWVAHRYGDRTALDQGRLSLNPLRHIDLVGTLLVPGLMLFFTPFVFGWAKPVPVDPRNFKRPKTDMAVVAVAGPASNLVMLVGWAMLVYAAIHADGVLGDYAWPLVLMGVAGMFINGILMVLNMLPLPPLDGGRVLTGLLPISLARPFSRLERWGFPILVLLLFSGTLAGILGPVLRLVLEWVAGPLSGLTYTNFGDILDILTGRQA